jgi:hypothetical protein
MTFLPGGGGTLTGSGGVLQISATVKGSTSGSGTPLSYSIANIVMMSDANYTPVTSELSCSILCITSTTLTTTREIILPNVTGASYSVYNGTTGGQSLTFIGTSGTGISVPNGLKTTIYFDGTNYVTGSIIVGGDLSATNNISQKVIALQGNSLQSGTLNSSQDGYVLTWDNADGYWVARPVNNESENHTITSTYTINSTQNDYNIFCNQSTGFNLTLPVPVKGATFQIWDISGTAETNNITLVRHGSENINGIAASRVLSTNWGHWTVVCYDGTNWITG